MESGLENYEYGNPQKRKVKNSFKPATTTAKKKLEVNILVKFCFGGAKSSSV